MNTWALHSVEDHSPRLSTRCENLPARLLDNHFYAAGRFSISDTLRPAIAIIGTRRPTSYGIRFVRELMPIIKKAGDYNIVSGGALGIDAEAHMAALRCELPTHAWLVGPMRRPNPASHAVLFERMKEVSGCGLFVPRHLEPGPNGPVRQDWLKRNEWVVAAADVVIVIEASEKSGTWSTVKAAREMGIPIFVLPGPVFSVQSDGTNSMIAKGYGHPITSIGNLAKSLVVELGGKPYNYIKAVVEGNSRRGGPKHECLVQTPNENKLLNFLRNHLDENDGLELRRVWQIADEANHPVLDLLKTLDLLVARGELRKAGDRFERKGDLR